MTVMPEECAGPSRIARPGRWLLVASVWLVALMIAPAVDVVDRADPVGGIALVAFAAAAMAAVLSSAFPERAPTWLGPVGLGVMAFLAVVTSFAFGEAWFGTWVVFAASTVGVYRDRGSVLMVLAVPLSASLVLWGAGAGASVIGTLALTVFLAGAANLVLVRLLVTIGELRVAQRELAGLAVVEERERFSRDLHDLLGHTLSVIVVKAEAVRRLSQRDPDAAMRHTIDIEAIGRQALVEVREAVDGYRRTTLAGELARARVALEAAGVHADLQVPARPLPLDVEEALAWVVREGVTNVVRHSGARACRLRIDVHDGTARLTLDDDGRSASPTEPGGGLTGMRQRLETVDGTLVTTRDDDGFALVATVPVPVLDDTDTARATEQA